MKHVFVELFNYKDDWRLLPRSEREEYASAVLAAVGRQGENGVEVISWGFNDFATDRRAPYDFHCVYLTPSAERQRSFEAEIAAAGWYELFDQVNVSGTVSTPEKLLQACAQLEVPKRDPK